MDTYDIMRSIYLATVKGISKANQNEGMIFNFWLWQSYGILEVQLETHMQRQK